MIMIYVITVINNIITSDIDITITITLSSSSP